MWTPLNPYGRVKDPLGSWFRTKRPIFACLILIGLFFRTDCLFATGRVEPPFVLGPNQFQGKPEMDGTVQSQRRKSVTKTTLNSSSGPAPSPASTKKSTSWLTGRRIKIKTETDEEIEGTVYTYDRTTNFVALECSTQTPTNRRGLNFRLVKISHIKEIISVDGAPHESFGSDDGPLAVSYVNIEQLQAREAELVKNRRQRAAKIGVGVTKEAQDIFDALSKTLPCRWSNDTIVVLDEVLIQPPYGVADCKANAGSASSLARVRKVLEGERKRLENARK